MTGQQFSRFYITKELPSSPALKRYQAKDLRLEREVLLTVLSARELSNASLRKTLLYDLQKLSSINLPVIATVYQTEELPDGDFLVVSPYYGTRTLAQELSAGPCSIQRGILICHQIVRGMAQAHANGLIHGRLGPEHITLLLDDEIRIENWGIAHFLSLAGQSYIATPLYCPPPEEIIEDTLTSASDVWAFGILLHLMMTGNLPFHGKTESELSYAVMNMKPSHLTKKGEEIPSELLELVNQCLEQEAYKRPHMQQVAAQFEKLANTIAGTTSNRKPRMQRSRTSFVIVICFLVALFLAGFLLNDTRLKSRQQEEILVQLPRFLSSGAELQQFASTFNDQLVTGLAQSGIAWAGVTDSTGQANYALRLESNFLLVEDKVRISVKLIEVKGNINRWAENFDCNIQGAAKESAKIVDQVLTQLCKRLEASR